MTRLLLIPTAMERDHLLHHLGSCSADRSIRVELCGFGVVAAAAATARLIEQVQPSHVLLAGIAGTIDANLLVGSAYWFGAVRCSGIGVGWGSEHQSAQSIGWSFAVDERGDSIGDQLSLVDPGIRQARLVLRTVCAASSRPDSYPNDGSNAEDMEGFAVAFACRMANVPCGIVRGISNEVGDRRHEFWNIDGALAAVAREIAGNASWRFK